ncbi:MAG: YeeE/YedE family protein [Nitrospirae bacterium]|nr:YeeE/YedE family protein [Nitrospirota bacterium]
MTNSLEKNKIWAMVVAGLLVIVSLIYFSINIFYIYLVVYIWFGVIYGMLLQYGRFCMASALRDLFGLGVTRMFAGIMLAVIIFSIIMAFLETIKMTTFHTGPFGGFRIVGGLIFGIGMVMSGGCASGTLYKCGEGNGTSMLALTAITISQAVFVNIGGYFDKFTTIYVENLPEYSMSEYISTAPMSYFIGNSLLNTIIPAIILLIIAYVIWGRKSYISNTNLKITLSEEISGFFQMLAASKKTVIAGLLIGIAAGAHVFTIDALRRYFDIENFGELLKNMGYSCDINSNGRIFDPGYWYITTQEAQLGAWFLKHIGINTTSNLFFNGVGVPFPLRNPALWMSLGIIFGASIMALWNNEFKIKIPKGEFIVWGLLGGTLMGIGARAGMGCNIGAFFIRVAGGDPSGWLFGLGLAIGSLIGVKFFDWWTTRKLDNFDDFGDL